MQIKPLPPPGFEDDPLYAEAQTKKFLKYQLKRKSLSLSNACLIVHLADPEDVTMQTMLLRDKLPPNLKKFIAIVEGDFDISLKGTIENGIRRVAPADFIEWLESKGFIPPELFTEVATAIFGIHRPTPRDLRKQKTIEKRQAWNERFAELKKINPKLSKNAAAKFIAKEIIDKGETTRGNDSETIRKYLMDPKKKVGR